jgi:hypothetical protein
MKKSPEFDIILDECLQHLIEGESIEACLSRYPEHAAELGPLLRTARETLRAVDIRPRPEFRQRAVYQFQNAIREMPAKERRDSFFILKPWLVAVIAVVVVLLAGGGTVAAASNSLPDNPLYSVKLATESVRVALTPSALGKAELHARFADKRVDEIIEMAQKGKGDLVEKTTDRLNKQLVAVANLAIPIGQEVTTSNDMASGASQPSATVESPKGLMAPAPAPTATPVPAPSPTATATAHPATTTVPAPEATPPPSIVTAQPPENTPTPAITISPAAPRLQGQGGSTFGAEEGVKQTEEEKFKQELSRQAYENWLALQEELEKAPESIKPALQRAINVAEQAYQEALQNLQ